MTGDEPNAATHGDNGPGFKEGLVGIPLEVYYTIVGPSMHCEDCDRKWRGYYAKHMNYCHFCGRELVEL